MLEALSEGSMKRLESGLGQVWPAVGVPWLLAVFACSAPKLPLEVTSEFLFREARCCPPSFWPQ